MTWWIDVTSVRDMAAAAGGAPSGIQRVVLELMRAARDEQGAEGDVRLTVFDPALPGFREADWARYSALIDGDAGPQSSGGNSPRRASLATSFFPIRIKRLLGWGQRTATSGAERVVPRKLRGGGPSNRKAPWVHPFAPDDVWINAGGWWVDDIAEAMADIAKSLPDLLPATLIYDCIPLALPEFTNPDTTRRCRTKLPDLIAGSKLILSVSDSTTRDIRRYMLNEASEAGMPTVSKVRLGTEAVAGSAPRAGVRAVLSEYGLIESRYVLVVGTIENRKNHALAFRAWRVLLEKYAARLPELVFVGRWGLKSGDLRAQLEHCAYLDGRIRVLNGLDDRALDAVYRGCLFTLFPSVYEGWGLPVSESHAYGKVCVVADNSSLKEAGKGLAEFFSSDCRPSLVETIERLLFEDGLLASRQKRVRDEFKPVAWRSSWLDIVHSVRAARSAS
jgi:glycosyltransferase involved in cell wall biosynthesis